MQVAVDPWDAPRLEAELRGPWSPLLLHLGIATCFAGFTVLAMAFVSAGLAAAGSALGFVTKGLAVFAGITYLLGLWLNALGPTLIAAGEQPSTTLFTVAGDDVTVARHGRTLWRGPLSEVRREADSLVFGRHELLLETLPEALTKRLARG